MCLHRQFFFPMRFVILLNADISWIFVCRASFHQVAALIALSGYFFSTHTMLSTIKPKSYCLLLLKKRCKVVVARATYFISLKDVSFASKNHEANIADTAGIEPATFSLGGGCSTPLSYVSMWGLVSWIASPVSATADNKRF